MTKFINAPDTASLPQLPVSVFEANTALNDELQSIFLKITQHFVNAGAPSPFVALFAVDRTGGEIVEDAKEDPTSENAV